MNNIKHIKMDLEEIKSFTTDEGRKYNGCRFKLAIKDKIYERQKSNYFLGTN